VAWLGGAAGLLLFESRRLARIARPLLLGLMVVLLGVPGLLGAGVHQNWAMPMFSSVQVPVGLVRVAEYMRDHGPATDVFQDSQFDRVYALAALAERRTYVAHTMTLMPHNADRVDKRSAAIERFMALRDPARIAETARDYGLRWFLLEPSDSVAWPAELADHPTFALDGFRLYRF